MTRAVSPRSTRIMRRIDQHLGPPLCLALGLLRSCAERWRPARHRAAGTPIRKVLVIKFWGMGSIVMATPALRALKKSYPDCRVTFLTFAQNEAICRMIQAIDRVHPYDAGSVAAFVRSFIGLVRLLRRERFDTVIDMEFFSNFTSIVTALSGAALTVGFHTPKFWRERFYTKRVSFDHSRHVTEIFLKALQALGADTDDLALAKPVPDSPALRTALDRVLAEHKVAPADLPICVSVNAGPLDYKRRWPLASYGELIRRIATHYPDHRIVLIGAADEAPYVDEVAALIPPNPRVTNLCGLLEVEQLVLLLQRSQLFIGNDGGPLHLAAAVGVPTVSFFGPETPSLYGPRGTADTVLYKNVPCSPCLNAYYSKDNSSCRNNVCMKSISVDEAWAAVQMALEARSASLPRVRAAIRQ